MMIGNIWTCNLKDLDRGLMNKKGDTFQADFFFFFADMMGGAGILKTV